VVLGPLCGCGQADGPRTVRPSGARWPCRVSRPGPHPGSVAPASTAVRVTAWSICFDTPPCSKQSNNKGIHNGKCRNNVYNCKMNKPTISHLGVPSPTNDLQASRTTGSTFLVRKSAGCCRVGTWTTVITPFSCCSLAYKKAS
jgi:hypothetical protein